MTAFSLQQKHRELDQRLARLAARHHPEPTRETRIDPASPAGRRLLRGVPVVGMGGLDSRRDPLLVVMDAETWTTTIDQLVA